MENGNNADSNSKTIVKSFMRTFGSEFRFLLATTLAFVMGMSLHTSIQHTIDSRKTKLNPWWISLIIFTLSLGILVGIAFIFPYRQRVIIEVSREEKTTTNNGNGTGAGSSEKKTARHPLSSASFGSTGSRSHSQLPFDALITNETST